MTTLFSWLDNILELQRSPPPWFIPLGGGNPRWAALWLVAFYFETPIHPSMNPVYFHYLGAATLPLALSAKLGMG
jgi:hypothetical protein